MIWSSNKTMPTTPRKKRVFRFTMSMEYMRSIISCTALMGLSRNCVRISLLNMQLQPTTPVTAIYWYSYMYYFVAGTSLTPTPTRVAVRPCQAMTPTFDEITPLIPVLHPDLPIV